MDFESATEMSSSTVDDLCLQNNPATPATAPTTPLRSRARAKSVATEFPFRFEAQTTTSPASQLRVAFQEHLQYVHARNLHRCLKREMDAVTAGSAYFSRTVDSSSTPTTTTAPDTLLRQKSRQHHLALRFIFKRNGIPIYMCWESGRDNVNSLLARFRSGTMHYIFDEDCQVRPPPPRRRTVAVWKMPRERAYYLNGKQRREAQGGGDVVEFVLWREGVLAEKGRVTPEGTVRDEIQGNGSGAEN